MPALVRGVWGNLRQHLFKLVLGVAVVGSLTWHAYPQAPTLHVGELTLVSSVRASRTHFDYTYRIQLINSGGARRNVAAYVSSTSANTNVLDNEVLVGNLAAGATVTPADTFTIRHDRSFAFSPASLSWRVESEAANTAPVANAGPDQTLRVGDLVTLDGTGSTDADGNTLTYRWRFLSQPSQSAAALINPSSATPSFTIDRAGSYVVELIVNDGQVDSSADTVQISTSNSGPVADAGADRTVPRGSLVTLDGTGSTDPDGDALDYRWQLTERPSGSSTSLVAADSATPQLQLDRPGTYTARLTVNDGVLTSAADEVRISTENSIPVADAGPNRNGFVDDTITLDGSASTDADDDALSYEWTFTSRPVGSDAAFNATDVPTPSFVADEPGLYIAQLIVNDGFADSTPDTATVSIEVRPQPPADRDNDGLTDAREAQLGTNPDDPDSDDDGLLDGREVDSTHTDPRDADSDDDSLSDGAEVDTHLTDPNNADTDGDSFSDGEEVQAGSDPRENTSTPAGSLPPDPAVVAPAIDLSLPTRTFGATQFLYSGANPIQTGVAAQAIDATRAAVIRGRVLGKDNLPLPGVTISVRNYPQLGQTKSRADGNFDLAVNGGGVVTLDYRRGGYLPAQRQVAVTWQQYAHVDEVVLIQQDTRVTTVNLAQAQAFHVAQGSPVTDSDGTRQATLLIPQGTQARIYNPDGTTTPISTLNLRLTEYTVGSNGPESMPAPLPPTSGYTYAFEMRADEATVKIAGKDVLFDRPVSFYITNFLDFPVGGIVPVGYYDQDAGAWVPSANGRVIRILANAQLDTNGDDQADSATVLGELGITDAERAQLASLYAAGQTLWRVQVTHLSTWDCNWPVQPPLDATEPKNAKARSETGERGTRVEKPKTRCGSVVECENQTLRETLSITGTSSTLHYASDRVPGRTSTRILNIPLTGEQIPPSLKRVDLIIDVAGRHFEHSFAPQTNLTFAFDWDGRDGYGRTLSGSQTTQVRIGYAYDPVYATPAELAAAFARFSGVPLEGSRARNEIRIWQEYDATVGTPYVAHPHIGGWSLSDHHQYDPFSRTLYLGDGSRRSAEAAASSVVSTVAGVGGGFGGNSGDGGPATQARFFNPVDVVFGPDGSFYIGDAGSTRVRRVSPNGIISAFAGNGQFGHSGDGGPATQAALFGVRDLATGPDGSVYIADSSYVLKVTPDGIIRTVAGAALPTQFVDGVPAIQSRIVPNAIAVGPDGSLYIGEQTLRRVRKVAPDGIIITIAGAGIATGSGGTGDGGPALSAGFSWISDLAIGPDGSLYVADEQENRVRRITPDGLISTVAGNGQSVFGGDNGPASLAGIPRPQSIAIGPDGSLYVDSEGTRIRRITPDGVITTFAGTGLTTFNGDGGPATQTNFSFLTAITFGPDGALYFGDGGDIRIRRISPAYTGVSAGQFTLASDDGMKLYRFDLAGRHISTIHALTGATLMAFGYDSAGRLATATDGNGLVTSIERGANGPLAIVAPFGERTTLTTDADGNLSTLTNPAGERYAMTYAAGGLLTALQDPLDHSSTFTYDARGRLSTDRNAAAGSLTLARTELNDGHSVSVTTAQQRTSNHTLRDAASGVRERRTTEPDGTTYVTQEDLGGLLTMTAADGTAATVLRKADPRFSMQSPINATATVTTGGVTFQSNMTRAVALATTGDPLSLTSLTDTLIVNGRTTRSVYNQSTKTFTETSAANRTSTRVIDSLGRTVRATKTGLLPIELTYDPQGRLASITQGTGADQRTVTYAYNSSGLLETVTDPTGRQVHYDYDAANRLTTQTLPDGRQTLFAYDAKGNLGSLTPPARPPHSFAHTSIDRVREYTAPTVTGGGTQRSQYDYDLDEAITQITRPDALELDFDYDTAGRLSRVITPEGDTTYSYSSTTGKLNGAVAPGGETMAFSYGGALLSQSTWSGTVSGSVQYGYDSDFRVASIAVNGAGAFAYTYDADSLLATVANQTAGITFTLARSPQNGLLSGTTLGSVTDTYAYNGFAEETGYVARHGSTEIFRTDFVRDKLGRIARKTETVAGTTVVFDYAYDVAGRLAEVRRDSGIVQTFGYDGHGNRTHLNGAEIAHYDSQDRLLDYGGTTYDYTANGERRSKTTAGASTSYRYDVLGNLRAVTLPDGTEITYVIDAQDRRIGKKRDGTLEQAFVYQDDLKPAAELDGQGNVVARFVYATDLNVPDLMIRGGTTYRFIKDHLGSPRLIVDVTTNAVAQRLDYDAWGNVVLDSNPGFQPFGFAGGLYDRDTGLVRFGARDYDAAIARWTTRDPIGFASGETNLYVYAANDPVLFMDPWGMDCTSHLEVALAHLQAAGAYGLAAIFNAASGVAYSGKAWGIGVLKAIWTGIEWNPRRLVRRWGALRKAWKKGDADLEIGKWLAEDTAMALLEENLIDKPLRRAGTRAGTDLGNSILATGNAFEQIGNAIEEIRKSFQGIGTVSGSQ